MHPSGDGTAGRPACFAGENGGFSCDHDESADPNCRHCEKCDSSSSYSYSSAAFDSIPLKDSEKLRRIVTASAKGFTIGAGLKGGLALFSILARLRRRKVLTSLRKEGVITNSKAIVLAVKETLRYGLFLGTFAGTFVSVDEIIGALGGHRSEGLGVNYLALLELGFDKWIAVTIIQDCALEGSGSGGSSRAVDATDWVEHTAYELGNIHTDARCSLGITMRDKEQAVWANLSAYILKQESLPPSYKSFLNKHGGKDSIILQGVKQIASGMPFTYSEEIENYYKGMGEDIKLDPEMKVPCTIIHGNQSCSAHFLSFFLQAYKRAVPVYLPVYLIPALIVHRQDLLKRPYTILGKGLLGTARSSLFLSAYCSSAWAWTCLLFRIFKRCNIPMVAMGTFPTGLALAIEKKSRRIEISLYCLARAIESFFTCMAEAGYLPQSKNLKRADVVIFSLSTAIIMHCYSQEREVFRSKYLNVLDWVFGVPPPPCETPRCKNS